MIDKIAEVVDNRSDGAAQARILTTICVLLLCGILLAGLWPFHSPRNQVGWLTGKSGLRFEGQGDVLSLGAFGVSRRVDTSCSLEIWLKPDRMDSTKTVLAFDGSSDPTVPFRLLQDDKGGLAVQRYAVDQRSPVRRPVLEIGGVFHEGATAFVTVTAGGEDTAVYVDGVPAKVSSRFGMSSKDLQGQLVLGSSLVSGGWAGQILGLAVYYRQLTPSQVAQHYENWTTNRGPIIGGEEPPAALYLFDEGVGDVAHNQIDPATNLTIPPRYRLLHPQLLRSAGGDFRFGWPGLNYWTDVATNIAGFIPVGFFFVIYFTSVLHFRRPASATILLGLSLSLTIESLQSFLPTRDSGMTDVITNTLGTALGAFAGRWPLARGLFARAGGCATSLMDLPGVDRSPREVEKVGASA